MTALPNRHPIGDEFLLDYAAGTAPEPIALVVASHVALNPQSRETLSRLEAAGGALLNELPPASVAEASLERVLARLETQEATPLPTQPRNAEVRLPEALRAYLPEGIEALPWRRRAGGLAEAELPCGDGQHYKVSLLRIGAGKPIPRHGHSGEELLLVLQGGFADEHGHYVRGDVCFADAAVEHRPLADADGDCLCLAVTEGPIRLKGLPGFLLRPFLRR
jgi:putative transcriptional regulator